MIPQTAEWRTLGMRAERLVRETRILIAATNLALQESAKNLHYGGHHEPPPRSSRNEPGRPSRSQQPFTR